MLFNRSKVFLLFIFSSDFVLNNRVFVLFQVDADKNPKRAYAWLTAIVSLFWKMDHLLILQLSFFSCSCSLLSLWYFYFTTYSTDQWLQQCTQIPRKLYHQRFILTGLYVEFHQGKWGAFVHSAMVYWFSNYK